LFRRAAADMEAETLADPLLLAQLIDHVIEGGEELAELIRAGGGDPAVQFAGGHIARGGLKLVDGAGDEAAHEQRGANAEDSPDHADGSGEQPGIRARRWRRELQEEQRTDGADSN
jgi:hypothetical protein